MEEDGNNLVDIVYSELQKKIKHPLTKEDKELIDKISVLSRNEFNILIKGVAIARYYKKRYEEGKRITLIREEIVAKFKFKSASQIPLFMNSRKLKNQIEMGK